MQSLTCKSCGQEHPKVETVEVAGTTLCKTCAEKFVDEHPHTPAEDVRNNIDPTVCVNCGADNGDSPHALLMQLPACGACINFFRHRPFPAWIKISFAALVFLVLFSMVWNWRFFAGHFEIKAAFQAMVQGNIEEAVIKISAAAKHVPESQAIRELAKYFQGLLNLKDEKWQDAIDCFSNCSLLPREYEVPLMLSRAEAGLAFDQKDYDRFLQAVEAIAREQPGDPMAIAAIASALACKYAVSGDDNLRRQAEDKLTEAKNLGLEASNSGRYEERIRHRLETREIIDSEEFMRRFPDGWQSQKDKK
jgi:hypothetical protein